MTTLADEWEVAKLAHRYALALDRSDLDEWGRLFTDDCVWQTVGRPAFNGLSEVMSVPTRLHGAFATTFHAVLTQHNVLDGDEGRGQTYCEAYHNFINHFVTQGRDPVALTIKVLLRYDDRFRKVDGVWKFSGRTLVMINRQIDQVVEYDHEALAAAIA